MKFARRLQRLLLLGCAACAMAAGLARAQQPMVEWVLPALPTNKPQTEHQAEEGRKQGRELPPPEVLQPTLDTALQSFKASKDAKLTGTFKGASSDVLVVLVQKWFDKFKTYYPGVSLSIAPPYAGS